MTHVNTGTGAHHGTGLRVWRQSDDTEKVGQSDHFELPVQMMLVVPPDPNTVITSSSTTFRIKKNTSCDKMTLGRLYVFIYDDGTMLKLLLLRF